MFTFAIQVRAIVVTLLSRFWIDLAPSMGGPEGVQKSTQLALTLKIKGGLKLAFRQHVSQRAVKAQSATLRDWVPSFGVSSLYPTNLVRTGAGLLRSYSGAERGEGQAARA